MDPLPMMVEPFDPKKHKPQDIIGGPNHRHGPSTEITITEMSPDGNVWNIPTVWFTPDGRGHRVEPQQAQYLAQRYEQETGRKFPRFTNFGQGDFSP